jgi:hypothetical protein
MYKKGFKIWQAGTAELEQTEIRRAYYEQQDIKIEKFRKKIGFYFKLFW